MKSGKKHPRTNLETEGADETTKRHHQTEVLYRNYLKEVRRSGVLRTDAAPPSGGDSLSEVLASSRSLARREFASVHQKMKTLFGLADTPRTVKHADPRYRKRLLCVEIQAKKASINEENVRTAVVDLSRRMSGEIKKIRENHDGGGAELGREYARKALLYVNTLFALQELGGEGFKS